MLPVIFIHGPADPVLPYRELRAQYEKYLPHVSVEQLSERIGHYPQLEAPEELLEKYMVFLKSKVGLAVPEAQAVFVMPQQIPKPSIESY